VLKIGNVVPAGSHEPVKSVVPETPAVLSFALLGANPARGVARMQYGLPTRSDVTLELFDVQGRRVRTLAKGVQAPGMHSVEWKGQDDSGAASGAGIYFVRFRTQGREFQRRLVWLR